MDEQFLSLIRSVTSPRVYLHSYNVSELSVRISATFREMPVHVGVGKAPLTLRSVNLSHVRCAKDKLLRELSSYYFADLLYKTPQLLGSLDIIGNPTQLIAHVRDGVSSMVSIPMESLNDGPSAFVWGTGRGMLTMLQHLSTGTFSSVASFSDSVARNIERISGFCFVTHPYYFQTNSVFLCLFVSVCLVFHVCIHVACVKLSLCDINACDKKFQLP